RSKGFVHAALDLKPGTYVLGITGLPAAGGNATYRLSLVNFAQDQEPVPPLTIGPGSAVRIRPATGGPAAAVDASVPAASSTSAGFAQRSSRDVGAIPSSVVSLLATGPIGGLGSNPQSLRQNDAPEAGFARAPDVLLTQVATRLPLLIAAQQSGTAQDAQQ